MRSQPAGKPETQPSRTTEPRRLLHNAAGIIGLYAVLVLYMFAQRYMLEHWLSKTYSYFLMAYDNWRSDTYFWICILTPLSVLPTGSRLESASHFILPIFMTFVCLPTPLFLVHFVPEAVYWPFYGCLFLSYAILAVSTRLTFKRIPSPLTERGYVKLLAATLILFAIVFAVGGTQSFHLVDFARLYEVRYSDEAAGVLVQRFAVLYVFCFGGLFFSLCLMFKRKFLAVLTMLVYVVCYGLLQYKAAILAPFWFAYIYVLVKYFNRTSAIKYYLALAIPLYVGVVVFMLFPSGANAGGNLLEFAFLGLVVFRLYGVTANATGLYYTYFQSHEHTYWSHITGINFFVDYPYGDHTVAIEMERFYGLGNYNSSFIATEGIASYGYQALPVVSLVVGALFVIMNTAARGIGPQVLALLMIMPGLLIDERPLGTSLLTGGLIFLVLYLAWMPRNWLARSQDI